MHDPARPLLHPLILRFRPLGHQSGSILDSALQEGRGNPRAQGSRLPLTPGQRCHVRQRTLLLHVLQEHLTGQIMRACASAGALP